MSKNKKTKIERKKLFYTLGFFIFCVFGLTVAYSALSTTLNISGSAEVTSSSFGIKVEKLQLSEVFGDDYSQLCSLFNMTCEKGLVLRGNAKMLSEPVISDTTVSNFNLSVEIPGDEITVVYKVTNVGTIPVKLDDVIYSEPKYTSLNNSAADIEWAMENISLGGGFNYLGDDLESFDIGEVLCPGQSGYAGISFGISEDVESIPSGVIEISNISVTYDLVQADMSMCS